jgi:hypothetical protein
MPTAEPGEGFIAGALRPQMSHREISARGGRSKSPAILAAVLLNLQRAKAAKKARSALK